MCTKNKTSSAWQKENKLTNTHFQFDWQEYEMQGLYEDVDNIAEKNLKYKI